MIDSLKGQLANWNYTRGITLKFISALSDGDLDKRLPRKELNTIRLQVEELAMMHIGQVVAFCYATGIHIPDEITETMALDG